MEQLTTDLTTNRKETNMCYHSVKQIMRLCLIAAALAFSPAAMAVEILPGYDYLSTLPGTNFNMPPLGGVIPLQGNPIGLSPNTNQPYDTVVLRLETAHIGAPSAGGPASDVIVIEMIELSLVSVDPVNISGTFFDVHVNLSTTTPSMGTMTIRHEYEDMAGPPISTYLGMTGASGTFDSFFDIFYDVALEPVGGGPLNLIVHDAELTLSSSGTFWTHGFLIGDPVIEQHPGQGVHVAHQVDITEIPEPAPAALLLLGLGGLGLLRRKRSKA